MHQAHRWSLPYPPSEAFHLVSVWVVCSLFVHHMFPSHNCHLHAQVLSSHGGRLLPFHGWVSIESDPSAYLCNSGCTYGFSVQGHPELPLPRRRLARRQPHWSTASGGFKNTEKAKALSWNWWHAHLHLDVLPLMVTWMPSQLYAHPVLHNSAWGNQHISESNPRITVKAIYIVITGRSSGDNEQGMPTCVPKWHEMCALLCACFPPRCSAMQIADQGKPLLHADRWVPSLCTILSWAQTAISTSKKLLLTQQWSKEQEKGVGQFSRIQ